ncbi:hypothetical protein EDD11_009623 [Mortierella claussenii]|nr:hypothetical protein EDD11_009623 [Mortierella claussenii]
MGTHISKVKSIDLDSWTPEQVENMIKWGNEKANQYWEARLPESSIPNENTSGIDQWIRSKYEWKQFASKGPVPDPSELGPIDEAMLMDLHGKSDNHSRSRAERSSDASGSFGIIAPPPSNSSRSSLPKRPTSATGGVQGADLFLIGQQRSSSAVPRPTSQEDFFGFNDPSPTTPASPVAQAQSKRSSIQSPQPQQTAVTQTSATQDLFSLVSPGISNGQITHGGTASSSQPAQSKPGNSDWKNSIMSLYGNQSSGSNRNSAGFHIGMQQQQQQQQQRPQQQNLWSNSDGFGAMQQATGPMASAVSGFDAFGTGSQSGFGAHASNGINRPVSSSNNYNANSASSQGNDLFSMIAGTTQSPVTSPPAQSKNSSAFGDLTWN